LDAAGAVAADAAADAARDAARDAAAALEREVDVRCACGFEFCFACSSEPHGPTSCAQRVRWLAMVAEFRARGRGADGARRRQTLQRVDAAWFESNTKPCPRCVLFVFIMGMERLRRTAHVLTPPCRPSLLLLLGTLCVRVRYSRTLTDARCPSRRTMDATT
jgi:hypothetical protein